MGFRYGVQKIETPLFHKNINVGTALIDEDGTVTLEYRGGYAGLLNEMVDALVLGMARGVSLSVNLIPAEEKTDG